MKIKKTSEYMEFLYTNPQEVEQPKEEKSYKDEMRDRIYHWIMNSKSERAVEVYGGVYHHVNLIIKDNEEVDFFWLSETIDHAISEACTLSMFGADKPIDILNNICHLFWVDPMLVKVYMSTYKSRELLALLQ